jgi:hypothetical protein
MWTVYPLLNVYQASSEKNFYFHLALNMSFEIFFTILCTVLPHGAGYVIFFCGEGGVVQDKVTS